jgi:hypothetical protein
VAGGAAASSAAGGDAASSSLGAKEQRIHELRSALASVMTERSALQKQVRGDACVRVCLCLRV